MRSTASDLLALLALPLSSLLFRRHPSFPPLSSMTPLIRVLEPFPWPRSTVTQLALEELVNGGQLSPTGDGPYPAWMVPQVSDREPNPP
jgi:hypothetical protein